MSLAVHGSIVAILFTTFSNQSVQVKIREVTHLFVPNLSLYIPEAPRKAPQGGGGGGDRSPLPASKGRAPKFSTRQFVPPAAVMNNPNPRLLMDPTLIGPVEIQVPNNNMAVWGDPLAKLGPPSSGLGRGGGIGDGDGGGIGPGHGPGIGPGGPGGITGGPYTVGGSVSAPIVVYRIEPEYSEEARKAKYSGTVLVYIEVDSSGAPRNLKVVKGIGLGLDEKALEAVSKWRFKPGRKDGTPVTVRAQVEVSFRLL
jgi:protein TonB